LGTSELRAFNGQIIEDTSMADTASDVLVETIMEERGTRHEMPMKPQVVAHELGKRLADDAKRWSSIIQNI
jgi:hypothetical protein